MNEAAESLGARLRAERERKGLSAQKAADDLHLDAWVVDALEGDDYRLVGPSVYVKGHLKRYAELLGLPVNEILAAYEGRTVASAPPAAEAAQASTLRLRASESEGQAMPWGLIGGVAAVVLVVAGALFLWKPWSARESAPAGSSPASAPSAAALPPAVAPDSNEAGNSDGTDSAAVAAASPSADAGVAVPPTAAVAAKAPAVAAAVNTLPVAHRDSATPAGSAASGGSTMSAAVAASAGSAAPPGDAGPGAGKARLRLSFSADSWVEVRDASGRRLFAGSGRANSVKTIAGEAPLQVYLGFASGVQVEVNNRVVAIGPQFMTGDVAQFDAGADGILRRDHRPAAEPRPRG